MQRTIVVVVASLVVGSTMILVSVYANDCIGFDQWWLLKRFAKIDMITKVESNTDW